MEFLPAWRDAEAGSAMLFGLRLTFWLIQRAEAVLRPSDEALSRDQLKTFVVATLTS